MVYLTASVDQLLARTSKDKKRPLLQVADPRTRIEQLLRERGALYQQLADLTLQTDGRGSKWVVQQVLQWLNSDNMHSPD